jgi:phosphotransferase system enzyme I (PtsI)
MEYLRLRGIGVSPGISIGEVILTERVIFSSRKDDIAPEQLGNEITRLEKAIERTQRQLTIIKNKVKEKVGEEHSYIFDAHLLIVKDSSLFASLKKIITEKMTRAEWAISQIHEQYMIEFESIADEYFRERKFDVSDVLSRV